MTKFIVNPQYVLSHALNKTFIFSRPEYNDKAIICIIHPIYAMMLSFFNGTEKDIAYAGIAELMHLPIEKIEKQMDTIIDNNDFIHNGISTFPPHILIEYKENMSLHNYKYNDFLYENIDLSMARLNAPTDIICNLTLRCVTSCVYCYADRKNNMNKHMPVELVERILEEAKEIGVLHFKLMGGEVLLYNGWERIVQKMVNYGLQPDISIKYPISEEQLLNWKKFGATAHPIQISLDTLIKEHLYKILKVKDPYYDSIINTVNLMEKHQIQYVVHTVISNCNDTIDDIKSLYHFFKGKNYLQDWKFDPAKCSMYNGLEYSSYKTSRQALQEIGDYIEKINKEKVFGFKLDTPQATLNFNLMSKEEKEKKFTKRRMCSGNLNAMYILPDGQVTICEELYWHPRFLLGDLKNQTLMEIWNSQKAKDLFYLQQDTIQTSSPCATCEDFKECRKYKHVCWRDTILAYGKDKWDYPDILCPKAPHITKDIVI